MGGTPSAVVIDTSVSDTTECVLECITKLVKTMKVASLEEATLFVPKNLHPALFDAFADTGEDNYSIRSDPSSPDTIVVTHHHI